MAAQTDKDDERVLYTCPCAVAYTRCHSGEDAAGTTTALRGHVVVTARRVLLRSAPDSAAVLAALPAREIYLSAISRDAAEPRPCVYCQCAAESDAAADGDEEGEGEDEPFDEVRIAPDDAACLEALHRAVCEAVALNPLPEDAASDDDDDDDDGRPAPCLPRLDFADAPDDDTREIGAPCERPAKVTRGSSSNSTA